MSGSRQKTRRQPTRMSSERGEASLVGNAGAEPVMAVMEPESPAATMHLMEEVCERENLVRAWQRVRGNKGAPGVDGMTIGEAVSYLREHWPDIRSQLLSGTYCRSRSGGWRYRSPTAGSGSSACLVSSID
jgi:RNA-directed DNA polymerase